MYFGRAFHLILMHFYILYSMLWGKLSKKKLGFFSKKHFFQNFDWSNLIFDQSKSCLKNSVSLYLVQLIEPFFRSIEHHVSSFLKTVLWLFQNLLFKKFFNFSSLSDLARQHFTFFVVFFLNFLQGFPPSRPVRPFYPSFWFYFHVFMHIFMHLGDIFGTLEFWDFWWFKACFLKLIIGFWWDIVIFMIGVD